MINVHDQHAYVATLLSPVTRAVVMDLLQTYREGVLGDGKSQEVTAMIIIFPTSPIFPLRALASLPVPTAVSPLNV